MKSLLLPLLCGAGAGVVASAHSQHPSAPQQQSKSFFRQIGNSTWILGNSLWNVTQNAQYANKLMYKGKDRVGEAVGHYVSYNGAASDLRWTTASIASSGPNWLDIRFSATEGDFHWVLHDDLAGAYQYFVNRALPTLGEFRTLWRLSNTSFPSASTNVKSGALPPFSAYQSATNVQDETWQQSDGTFLTKYDWAAFLREQTAYGVWGEEVGSWYLHPGKEYLNGDHLKQELMVHRESKTGDTVQLNMLHGTHYQASSRDSFATGEGDARIWGPWLWYLNDGSRQDAAKRWEREEREWPYAWFNNTAYQSRGAVQGKLLLSDGRPAAGAAVFLGDNRNETVSTLDQGQNYYYTAYADDTGAFRIRDVRSGTYALYAWGNGSPIADVITNFTHNDVEIVKEKTTMLPSLTWPVTNKTKRIFQIGDFDRKTDGFYLADGAIPVQHARIDKCPANLTYTVGTSTPSKDWCFGQSKLGTWSVSFSAFSANSTAARLVVSLAGFSQGSSADILLNEAKIGNITSASLANSQDTYRGATRAGEWRRLEFGVPRGLLKEGQNRLDVRVTRSTQWRGWLWDSLVLEAV
ncbi:polysaccharide lyase family 4 protein [Bipolaris oryzae ATCC 44560]|uniref:rhamnogalacturonan endolyase n=1 Tax=Bipolaris oryzae ATCC 44560 TaxID=930090 RepID=W6ZCP3_COCMI|nr:polysaccharide lyase family 4 protein [Bipolaris oryzae ATCC 44560]EUC49592.1 polysaccharide lyase family 4 protein [Bipolaris oryzae ATCC 44560]